MRAAILEVNAFKWLLLCSSNFNYDIEWVLQLACYLSQVYNSLALVNFSESHEEMPFQLKTK